MSSKIFVSNQILIECWQWFYELVFPKSKYVVVSVHFMLFLVWQIYDMKKWMSRVFLKKIYRSPIILKFGSFQFKSHTSVSLRMVNRQQTTVNSPWVCGRWVGKTITLWHCGFVTLRLYPTFSFRKTLLPADDW